VAVRSFTQIMADVQARRDYAAAMLQDDVPADKLQGALAVRRADALIKRAQQPKMPGLFGSVWLPKS
jgi:hypothetical protein